MVHASIIDKYKKKSWLVEHYSGTPKYCVNEVKDKIDAGLTPIIGIDYSGCKLGHALLAVAYEYDEQSDKVNKIFCLDSSAPSPRTAIWNSYIDVRDLRKPSIHVNDDPDYESAKCRITDYLILHDTDFDEYLLEGYEAFSTAKTEVETLVDDLEQVGIVAGVDFGEDVVVA